MALSTGKPCRSHAHQYGDKQFGSLFADSVKVDWCVQTAPALEHKMNTMGSETIDLGVLKTICVFVLAPNPWKCQKTSKTSFVLIENRSNPTCLAPCPSPVPRGRPRSPRFGRKSKVLGFIFLIFILALARSMCGAVLDVSNHFLRV